MKYLDYEIVERRKNFVIIEFVVQKYIATKFGINGYWPSCRTHYDKKFKLGSMNYPECDFYNNVVWVRGCRNDGDHNSISIPTKLFAKFRKLVIEYNLYMMVQEGIVK